MNKTQNTLYLIRGLPGSGKTTLAKELVSRLGGVHFEADHFFYNESGDYNFDASHLHRAHKECQRRTWEAMDSNIQNIIVSNTFTTEKEMQPYLDLARVYKYKVVTLIVENRHGNSSVHDVPEETMVKMRNRFSVKL